MTEYEIIYSKRKTLALEVTKNLEVKVRAPYRTNKAVIEKFVSSHLDWIEKSKAKITQKSASKPEPTKEQERYYKDLAKSVIPKKVAYFSHLTGLKPSAVHITSAKTRFGSCSGKNSVNFSWRLMQYPDSAIDYVVLHELAHIKHHNHSKEFYSLIARYMPDYKDRKKLLK